LATLSLEGLRAAVAADLSAFVYRLDGDGYRVIGRRPPAGAGLDGFELLAAARAQLEAGRAFGEYAVGEVACIGVTSAGRRSRGVVLLGRIGEHLTTDEVRTVALLCQVVGALLQTASGLG
jgi:hypothetical protein